MEVDCRIPRVMVVEVSTSPTLQIGPPVMLFPGGTNPAGSPRPLYDVTADGQCFLMRASLLATEVGDRTEAQGPGSDSEIRTYVDSRWRRRLCAPGIVVQKDAIGA